MGTHCAKCGVHKMVTPLGITRGSSLNISWGKCGVWLVDQWCLPLIVFLFVWLFITHWKLLISLSLMHAWFLYSFEALACWLYWLIFSLILTYGLSLLYDHSAHLDMYILLVAYLVHLDMIDSWLYIIMIVIKHAIISRYLSRLACV